MKDEQRGTREAGAEGAHIEARLPALIEGRLAADDEARVRAHCRACAACARALEETQAVWNALGAFGAPVLERPLWPSVVARIQRTASAHRLALRLAAAGAAVAGVVLGVLLGSPSQPQPSWQQETWTQVGSLLGEDEGSLDNIYLSLADEGGEQR